MSDNLDKCSDYLRLVRLVVDVGTETVRDLFYLYKPKHKVEEFFDSETIRDELAVLCRRHILSRQQFEHVTFTPDFTPDPDTFDLSLLITLLTNLFKWTIEPPARGWDKSVDDHDITLGADLLHLKELRNTLIGHSTNANIPDDEFETLWTQFERILLRIANTIDIAKQDEVKTKIDEYKSCALDSRQDGQYLAMLRRWHEETVTILSKLQIEVEQLCNKNEEFTLFFKNGVPERLLRYSSLLCECGLLTLACVMRRELHKANTELLLVLLKNQSVLVECNPSACTAVFKETHVETDISTWGIMPLAYIMLILFHSGLSPMEQKAVAGIGATGNDFAKVAFASLDSDKFRPYWTELITNLIGLSAGLDDVTQSECQILIKKHDTEPVDETVAHQYMLQLRQDCAPFQNLLDQHRELRLKLKSAVEQMQREGACFGKDHVIELKMMTLGQSKEKRDLAENILFTIWDEAFHKTGGSKDFDVVQLAVQTILDDIRGVENVKIVDVEKHCIILTMHCSSCLGLLNLLDFLESRLVSECTDIFSRALSDHCEEKIVVTAFVTAESMQAAMDTLYTNKDDDWQGICVHLQCGSVDAIDDMRSLLADSETINNVNQISNAMSECLGEKISISTSLEIGGIHDIYSDPSMTDVTSEWMDVASPPAPMQEFAHLKHLKDIVQDIDRPYLNKADVWQTMDPLPPHPRLLARSLSLESLFHADTRHDAMTNFNLAKFSMARSRSLESLFHADTRHDAMTNLAKLSMESMESMDSDWDDQFEEHKQRMIDWDDYVFRKRCSISNFNGESCISSSSIGSFTSLESLNTDRETKRNTIG